MFLGGEGLKYGDEGLSVVRVLPRLREESGDLDLDLDLE